MAATGELRTERLLLRQWRAADLDPWAAINADPEVRAHLGGVVITTAENVRSQAVMRRLGMRYDPADDFYDGAQRHVVFRL